MSRNKFKVQETESKPKKESAVQIWSRVLALFLALLMVLGAVSALISVFGTDSYALPMTEDGQDVTIAAGIIYDSDVTVASRVRCTAGFKFGSLLLSGENKHRYTELWSVGSADIAVTCQGNLTRSKTDLFSFSSASCVVYGYFAEKAVADKQQAQDLITRWQNSLGATVSVFPAYRNGSYAVRCGGFSTQAEAESYRQTLLHSGETDLTVAAPSDTGVNVIDFSSNKILFAYDGGSESALGLRSMPNQDGSTNVMKANDNYTYHDTLRFTRYITSYCNGVAVTNVLPLEQYVVGVINFEISANWSAESVKTFSVAIRTIGLNAMISSKHKTFDICNTTCCQVFGGATRENTAAVEAVASTKGQVACYSSGGKTKLISAVYSSSMGGVTNNGVSAWGAESSYLHAACTPWEDYENLNRGKWTVQYTPTELKNRLIAQGYTQIKADIAKVEILAYSPNSSYVYQIRFTDTASNSVTVTRTDKIRSVLNLSSANFVVGKAGQTVNRLDYRLRDQAAEAFFRGTTTVGQTLVPAVYAIDGNGSVSQTEKSLLYAMDGTGQAVTVASSLYALDGNGDSVAVTLSEKYASSSVYSASNLPDVATLVYQTESYTTPITLTGTAGNFVFDGRGWGHGVGMSAFGARTLSEIGYDYVTILRTYYQNCYLKTVTEYLASR